MIKIPGKIPITIHPIFFGLMAIIGWLNSGSLFGMVLWAPVIFFSVLIHEFGHALTALFFGQRAQIDLVAFGGVTQRVGKPLKFWQEFIIVLNGPLAGSLLAYLSLLLYQATLPAAAPILSYVLVITFQINVFWTILNLLPVHPLDGGRLLSITLEGLFGVKGLKVSFFLSLLVASSLTLLSFTLGQTFIGMVFLILTFESFRFFKETLPLTKSDQNKEMKHLLKLAEKLIEEKQLNEAERVLQELRDEAKKGMIFTVATEHLAKIYVEQQTFNKAHELLYPLKKQLSQQGLKLLLETAFQTKKWEEARKIGTKIHRIHATYDTALTIALACTQLGKDEEAIGWLSCAIKEGLPQVNQILAREEFRSLSSHPHFKRLLQHD